MSHENVECFLRAIDAFNRRERNEFLALADGDVELESRLLAVEGGYHGRDGVIRWWNNLLETFPDFTLETFPERHHFDPPHRIEPERLANSLLGLWQRAEP